jgi:hypothetical protein
VYDSEVLELELRRELGLLTKLVDRRETAGEEGERDEEQGVGEPAKGSAGTPDTRTTRGQQGYWTLFCREWRGEARKAGRSSTAEGPEWPEWPEWREEARGGDSNRKRVKEQAKCSAGSCTEKLLDTAATPVKATKPTSRRHSHSVHGEDGYHEEVVAREMAGVVCDPLGWISVAFPVAPNAQPARG